MEIKMGVSVDAKFNGFKTGDGFRNVYIGYQMSMLVMVQSVSFVKQYSNTKERG
jgi:hypothetical protein